MNNNIDEMIDEALDAKAKKKAISQWYNLRPILGYFNWAIFAILISGRETGKSYSVTNFFVDQ